MAASEAVIKAATAQTEQPHPSKGALVPGIALYSWLAVVYLRGVMGNVRFLVGLEYRLWAFIVPIWRNSIRLGSNLIHVLKWI